jgi:hypothetical protein
MHAKGRSRALLSAQLYAKKWRDLQLDDGDGHVAGQWGPHLVFLLFILIIF